MTRVKSMFARWGPALALMVLIYVVSAQPKGVIPDYGANDWLVKKSGHLLGYAALGWAYLRGLAGGRRVTGPMAALAVALGALYGASDEYHQSFVPGREATLVDVGIDTLGAALGVLAGAAWSRWRAATQTPARPAPPPSTR